MNDSRYDHLNSVKHSIATCGFPLLTGNNTLFGPAQAVRTEIWWRANAFLAKCRRSNGAAGLQEAMSRLLFKTDASWWISVQSKSIETILSDLMQENHDRESGFLNC